MGDIRIVWNQATGYGDWTVSGDDLDTSDPLQTAVLLSLFTDARAPDSLEIYSQDRRGWWGTTYLDREIGSLLWTLYRAVKSDGTAVLRRAEGYASSALQWLIDDGIAASISVTAAWYAQTNLGLRVVITQPSGNTKATFSFVWNTV